METAKHTIERSKKAKLLLVLPLLVLPFITLLFWSLGGGKGDVAPTNVLKNAGFNSLLPSAQFKADDDRDKLSYYNEAAADSALLHEELKKDPNRSQYASEVDSDWDAFLAVADSGVAEEGPLLSPTGTAEKETQIYQRLAALQKVITQPAVGVSSSTKMNSVGNRAIDSTASQEMKALEDMMQLMNASHEADPELEQLGSMLENILDIQHPQRVQEKLRQTSQENRGELFSVAVAATENEILPFESAQHLNTGNSKPSFFSLDAPANSDNDRNAIEALLPESQTIVNGATVKLQLATAVYIGGVLIPKQQFLYGIASLKGERLLIEIKHIQYLHSLFPVHVSVYDMDGIEGIYIPGAINRDVGKASAERSVQAMGLSTLDDSWGTQAAGLGVEAAKSLLSKKLKLIKVVVKAGYQVLLFDNKQKGNN